MSHANSDRLIGDTEAAVAFLHDAQEGLPWALTTFRESATFLPREHAQAREWIHSRNGRQNIYFHVNEVAGRINKKASREDIARVPFLHVDVDPRAGEVLSLERERILNALSKPPEEIPQPTYIIDSGGGFQALWQLEEPIEVRGDLERAEFAAGYNRWLEQKFGADSCHNIDRVLRLPGTINLPNDKKRARGRSSALASQVGGSGRAYSLTRFQPISAGPCLGRSGGSATVSGGAAITPRRIETLDDLPVPGWVKVLIAKGFDPDAPEHHRSRSEPQWAVSCALARAGVADDVHLGILTDPDLGISKSILDKGRMSERYALRQIQRARDAATHPALQEMNDRHIVVQSDGGACVVLSHERDPHGRERWQRSTFQDLKNRYCNEKVEDGLNAKGEPQYRRKGDWWLTHPQRRQVQGIGFYPDRSDEVVDGHFNLWRGYGCQPAPGDWSLIERHVREVLAGGDEQAADYILNWCAWALQHPGEPAETALVFRSDAEGTGKGTLGRLMVGMFGDHGRLEQSMENVTGRFNSQLRDTALVFIDEGGWREKGGEADRARLYSMITEDHLSLEGKGANAIQVRNHLKFIIASNNARVVPVGAYSRRFAIFEVSAAYARDSSYFRTLYEQINSGGSEAFLHAMLTRDLGDWHPREGVPDTSALRAQKLASLSPFDQWFSVLLAEGSLPGSDPRHSDVATSAGIRGHIERTTPELMNISNQKLASALRDWGCEPAHNKYGSRWRFPPLPVLRAKWASRYGSGEWSDPDQQWEGQAI